MVLKRYFSNKRKPVEDDDPLGQIKPAIPSIEPYWKELLLKRFWVLVAIGVGGLLISAIIDLSLMIEVTRERDEHKRAHLVWEAWFGNWHVASTFIRELGFASFIALVISVFIDRSSRKQHEDTAREIVEAVSKNVFHGVFSMRVPEPIVNETLSSVLIRPVVRTRQYLGFEFKELEGETDEIRQNYIHLQMTSRYTLENVSGDTADFPIRILIPKTRNPNLRTRSKLTKLTINNRSLTTEQIQSIEDEGDNEKGEIEYLYETLIGERESISVVAEYSMPKERSDTELWTSLIPTAQIDVEVDMRLDETKWYIDALHSGKLEATDGSDGVRGIGKFGFHTTSAILPFQGVHLWWWPTEVEKKESSQSPPV